MKSETWVSRTEPGKSQGAGEADFQEKEAPVAQLIPWSVGLCVNEILEFDSAKGQGETRGSAKYKALNKHN